MKRAWAYYQYATNLCSMYRDQDKMAEELQRIGELRYQQGEITLLEKNMMTTIAADLHNRWFQAKEEEKMALARFQWSCYSNDPIVPGGFHFILILYRHFGWKPVGSTYCLLSKPGR